VLVLVLVLEKVSDRREGVSPRNEVSGHFETLGEHGFENEDDDEDEDDFSGFAAALAPAADQTDHNALNDQFLGGDQIGIQRVLGL
jgi:hypothetical protein